MPSSFPPIGMRPPPTLHRRTLYSQATARYYRELYGVSQLFVRMSLWRVKHCCFILSRSLVTSSTCIRYGTVTILSMRGTPSVVVYRLTHSQVGSDAALAGTTILGIPDRDPTYGHTCTHSSQQFCTFVDDITLATWYAFR
jgi:hypothetical protein